MILRGNSLKGSYKSYFLRSVKQLVEEIPVERRKSFAEELQAKAALLGCKDRGALQVTLEHLTNEEGGN